MFVLWQVWYDNPASLKRKYEMALELGLRGVGFWNLDSLDYTSAVPTVQNETRSMWDAVHAFTGKGAACSSAVS